MNIFLRVSLLAAALISASPILWAQENLDLARLLKNGSVRVEREDGTPLIQYRDSEHFVPASVLKVATTYCALEELGADYHFKTLFFADGKNSLFVRGSGDPSLVSETLESIARILVEKMPRIDRIVIDTSFFEDALSIDGSERSLNPYDAKNAAFVGNFSSAYLTRKKNGVVVSAESQTPLTPLAKKAGERLSRGKTERVNLSSDWQTGVQYGGELLAAFLERYGAKGAMRISRGRVPPSARLMYEHLSPEPLSEITRSMLKYSTNFTANQLFLTLGASQFGAPASVSKGQQAMRACLEKRVMWRDFHIEEGSGLSRKNRVTAQQMTELLKRFERYSWLLPEQNGFIAKTGSLRGVNSLAGYFVPSDSRGRLRFSILINSEVPHMYKFQVAEELRNYLKKDNN